MLIAQALWRWTRNHSSFNLFQISQSRKSDKQRSHGGCACWDFLLWSFFSPFQCKSSDGGGGRGAKVRIDTCCTGGISMALPQMDLTGAQGMAEAAVFWNHLCFGEGRVGHGSVMEAYSQGTKKPQTVSFGFQRPRFFAMNTGPCFSMGFRCHWFVQVCSDVPRHVARINVKG